MRGGVERASDNHLGRLKSLHGGIPYRYLYKHIFPGLRRSHLLLSYQLAVPEHPVTESRPIDCCHDTVVVHDTVYVERVAYVCPPCRPFYMDIRTNILVDAAAIPNIGIEFYLGKNFSVLGNWAYAWWGKEGGDHLWRVYGGELGLRWWFGRAAHAKPLTGHHLGIYAGLFTYDFCRGENGYMGGLPKGTLWNRYHITAGVEYGYSKPIGRRLNLDFTLGLGYMGGEVRHYKPMDGHYVWQSTKRCNWIGPTKVEITLAWLIGCNNVNRPKTKGGKK